MDETPTAEKPHQRFTAQGTAYMRNLTREQLYQGNWIAVHHQEPPVKTERGTSFAMCFPILIVADYVENPEEVGEKVARILEAHWDDEEPEPRAVDWHVELAPPDEQTEGDGSTYRVMLPSGEWYHVIAVDADDALSDARLNSASNSAV